MKVFDSLKKSLVRSHDSTVPWSMAVKVGLIFIIMNEIVLSLIVMIVTMPFGNLSVLASNIIDIAVLVVSVISGVAIAIWLRRESRK